MAETAPSHEDLLTMGRDLLDALGKIDDQELGPFLLKAVSDPDERGSVAGALYAAIHDGRQHAGQHDGQGAATAALGVVAGLTGHTSDMYEAARLGSDVRAVERTVQTGDPRYVERRAKNVIVGRALRKAGVWRKLWKE